MPFITFILSFTYSEVNAFSVNLQLTSQFFFFKSERLTHFKLNFSISFKHQRAEARLCSEPEEGLSLCSALPKSIIQHCSLSSTLQQIC